MARPDPRDILRRYEEAKSLRSQYENDWRMAAAYCLPRQYGGWTTDGSSRALSAGVSNAGARRYAYDNTGVRALPKFTAILERICTPRQQRWHRLMASDVSLMRKRAVREYFDDLNDLLFKYRYAGRARFTQATAETYTALGIYGTGPMYVGKRMPSPLDRTPGLLYKACPMRDVFLLVDDEGNVDTVFRRMSLTALQFAKKFPQNRDNAPRSIAAELNSPAPSNTRYFEIVHVIMPRSDYDTRMLSRAERFPIGEHYIAVDDAVYVGEEGGYAKFPYITPRTFTEAGDAYGYSPAMQALPALGSVSQIKKTLLKQGNRAADPVLLAADDGVLNSGVDLRPGHVTYGAVNSQGQRLIHTLDTGNFQVGDALLQDERKDIEDSFFVNLFQILTEGPEMTATEVMENVAEKAALLAPTMGQLQAEMLAPLIERELDVLAELGELNGLRVPPELIEASGEYQIVYTSPMARSMYAEEVAGFLRLWDVASNAAATTSKPELLDHFDFDTALPEMSEMMSVPSRWMKSSDAIKAEREARQQQQQQQMVLENLNNVAGAGKVALEAQKAGAL